MLSLSPVRVLLAATVVLSVACVGHAPPPQSPHAAGVVYTLTSVSETRGVKDSARFDTTVAINQFAGNNGRTAITHVASRLARTDSFTRAFGLLPELYTLRTRGNTTVTVVDTLRHQYFDVDVPGMLQAMLHHVQRDLQPGDTVYSARALPDTVLDGMHLEHWRVIDKAHFTMPIGVSTFWFAVRTTTDAYIAPDSNEADFEFAAGNSQPLLAGYAYSREQQDAKAKLPRGLRVLTVEQIVSDVGEGTYRSIMTRISRMSDIRHVDLPADVFAIPAGYSRVPAPILTALGKLSTPN
jgi:hypothetical protein